MTFNAATFPHDLLALCGGQNIFADRERRYPLAAERGLSEPLEAGERDIRYPRVTLAEASERHPTEVWLPDEPYEFSKAEADVFAAALKVPIRRVAGSLLFWHGTRLLRALREVPAYLD